MYTLYYSPSETTVFRVAPFVSDPNVKFFTKELKDNAKALAELCCDNDDKVNTTVITESKSGKFKYMRAFYIRTRRIPPDAKSIGLDITMQQFLQQ
jgi:hypothetical protein